MTLLIQGKITFGIGRAAKFLSLEWVRRRILEELGFSPYSGTLNFALNQKTSEVYQRFIERNPRILVEPVEEGYSPGEFFRVKINDSVSAIVVIPLVPGYPRDVVEIVTPFHLKDRLGLKEGDEITVEILNY
ncbi:MAG: CTP-dependent riboflavin kinase [Candidatus Bathyarchaeota archaeon]|nr:MAG: CTP-dependent riboflavin kinase [Candidatus Bathyarchaeota archaeon]